MIAWNRSLRAMSDMRQGDERKVLSLLGLCVRAGKVVFGVPMICEAMRKGGAAKPRAVFEASDTSDNTHKRISDKCAFYGTRIYRLDIDGATLAHALGKSASLAAVAVTDEKMCAMVEENIKKSNKVLYVDTF